MTVIGKNTVVSFFDLTILYLLRKTANHLSFVHGSNVLKGGDPMSSVTQRGFGSLSVAGLFGATFEVVC